MELWNEKKKTEEIVENGVESPVVHTQLHNGNGMGKRLQLYSYDKF